MYKLVCTDLDGTLLQSGKSLDVSVKSAIKAYEEKGGKFCVVTGRMTVGALPICRALELHGELITYQGAVVSDIDSGKIVFEKTLPYDRAAEILQFVEEWGWYCQTYYGDKFYTATPTDFTRFYGKVSNAEYVKTNGKLSDYVLERKENVPKIIVMRDKKRIPEALEKLRAKFGKDYLINTSNPQLIEIIDRSVNKGFAVKNLAEKYGIKREEVICIGDSENDLTMIEYAGKGICVADGTALLKEKADMVAPLTCEEGAVRWVLENVAMGV